MRRLGLLLGLAGVVVAGACSDNSSAPRLTGSYKVDVRFFGAPMPLADQALFTNAATRIEQIVVGQPPLVDANGDSLAVCGVTGITVFQGTVDGIVIYASMDSIDGRGNVLAQSGPCYVRQNGSKTDFRTAIGVMKFDTADLATLAGSGSLQQVITHEMLHVLGFGSFWTGLGASPPDSTGANLLINYGPNVSYIGPGGIAGCKSVGGLRTCATSVPVEGSQGGDGTINSHWRESVFGNELMTGFINAGNNPLSKMTVRSLEDLGYTVDTTAADPYTHAGLSILAPDAFGNPPPPSPTQGAWEIGLPHRPRALPVIPGTGR